MKFKNLNIKENECLNGEKLNINRNCICKYGYPGLKCSECEYFSSIKHVRVPILSQNMTSSACLYL